MAKGRALGLVDDETWTKFEEKLQQIQWAQTVATSTMLNPNTQTNAAMEQAGLKPLKRPSSVEEILRRPGVLWNQLAPVAGLDTILPAAAEQVEIDVKYAGYVARAQRRVLDTSQMERVRVPDGIDWLTIDALSWEVRERLQSLQPKTLGQVHRMPGVTAAAVVVAALVSRLRVERSQKHL